ncbi:hypothetical protein EVAR_94751_1 [Eumeta japonica]|uniref:Uncharacterized protein n=1 Tax=Eumeta variegata TaxID=151549 RepID=A0A4C1UWG3_EUMVA|nr:hypothetical protein EVAR_94751_1 [Eumeta japonica]
MSPSACELQTETFKKRAEGDAWQKKNEIGIDSVETRSLRGIWGVSLKDKCKNSDVRERCGLKDVTRIEKVMLQSFGRWERTNESRPTKQIYKANMCDGVVCKDRSR